MIAATLDFDFNLLHWPVGVVFRHTSDRKANEFRRIWQILRRNRQAPQGLAD
jgi:hypothetical protein